MAGGVNPSLSLTPLNTRVTKARRWCLISGKQREDKPSFPLPSVLLRLSTEGSVLNLGRNNHQITNKDPHFHTQRQCLTSSPRIPDLLGLILSPEKPDIQTVLLNLRDDMPHQLSPEILTDQGFLHKSVPLFRIDSWLLPAG